MNMHIMSCDVAHVSSRWSAYWYHIEDRKDRDMVKVHVASTSRNMHIYIISAMFKQTTCKLYTFAS